MSNRKAERSSTTIIAWILFVVLLAGGLSVSLLSAETEDDLTDNETCFDCHLDEEFLGVLEVEGAQVHNPEDGSLKTEDHAELACIDCHMDILEIEHREDVERTVDCLECHDEVPQE